MRAATRVLAGATVGLITATLPGLSAPANADAGTRTKTMVMKRAGVNHATAQAHGYEVRVDSDGTEYSAPKGSPVVQDTRPGSCGNSWIYFTRVDPGRHYTSVYTGFDLAPGQAGAIYVDWRVSILDDFGVSHWPWHDPTASVHWWEKHKDFTAGGRTTAYADVQVGSIAELWDGTLCLSAGPTDHVRL